MCYELLTLAAIAATAPTARGIMTASIDIQIATPAEPALADGPVGLVIAVRNLTDTALSVDLPYPWPPGLQVRSRGRARPTHLSSTDRRYLPLELPPRGSQWATHELRRHLDFPGAGEFPIEIELHLGISRRAAEGGWGAREDLVVKRTATVTLVRGDQTRLTRVIEQTAVKLDASAELAQEEAVEALTHLSTPLALPALRRVLAIERFRPQAMRGLARIGTPPALDAIDAALPGGDLVTAEAGLKALSAHKHPVTKATLTSLLQASPAIQLVCLDHLVAAGTADQVPEVTPLAHSANPQVADAARRFLARFPSR